MYSMRTRVSYSQITQDLTISPEGIVNLLQDCATFHSEDRGFGCRRLMELRQGWFVTDYQLHIKRLPVMGEELIVETYPYAIKGMIASRYFKIKSDDGQDIITANSMWVLMNLADLKPLRISEEMKEAYGDDGKPKEQFENRKLPLLSDLNRETTIKVDISMLDSNHHVNNSRYISLAQQYTGSISSGSLLVEYKRQALLGDELCIYYGEDDGKRQVIIAGEDVSDPYFKLLAIGDDDK